MTDDDELTSEELGRIMSENAERAQSEWRFLVRESDQERRDGRPGEVGRPMVVWENAARCRCRVARLFKKDHWWRLVTDDWSIDRTEWLHRYMTTPDGEPVTDWDGVPVTRAALDAGQITINDLGKVRGSAYKFRLNFTRLPPPYRVHVGCDHAEGHLLTSDVMDAARKVVATGGPLRGRLYVPLN